MPVRLVVRPVIAASLLVGQALLNLAWALSDEQLAQVYTQSPVPFRFVKNMEEVESVDWLHTQIYTAELMKRDDIAEGAVERLLAISPTDLVGLSAQARLSVRQNQLRDARHTLNQLLARYPGNNSVLLLQSYLAIYSDKKADYKQLQLLNKLGRFREVIAKYEALFPYGMPTFPIHLDYLSLLSEDDANWQRVKKELEALNYRFPSVPALQLRLASHLRKREPGNPWVLATLKRLSLDPQVGRQAAGIWLRALSEMPVDASWAQQHAILASYFPRDLEIQQANRTAQLRWQQEQEWLKDPTYRARQEGIALIDSNNRERLDEAFRLLSYALTTRPNDPRLLESMGEYYLRRGLSAQALSYFKRAQHYNEDPDSIRKYRTLVDTAQFWTYLDRGDLLAEKGDLAGAWKYYGKAQLVLPEEPHSYSRQASLEMKKGRYAQAVALYHQALEKEALNGTALRGLLNAYQQQGGAAQALKQGRALTPAQQALVRRELEGLQVDVLVQQLKQYIVGVHSQQISKVLDELLRIKPVSPWVRKEIADNMLLLGRHASANRLMKDWAQSSSDPEMAFAYGLFLSQQERLEEAIAVMEAVPKAKRSASMEDNLERLKFNYIVNRALALNEQDPEKAARLLQGYELPDELDRKLRLASVWLRLGNRVQARAVVGSPELSELEEEALLQFGELLVELDDDNPFRKWREVARQRPFNSEQKNRYYQIVADYELYGRKADFAVGNIKQAHQTFQMLLHAGVENQDEVALRLAKTSRQLGDTKTFSFVIQGLLQRQSQLAYSQQSQLAAVLYDAGESEKARQVLSRLAEQKDGSAVDKYESLTLAMDNQQWQVAKDLAYQTLLADRLEKQLSLKSPENPQLQSSEKGKTQALPELSLETLYREADDYWLTRNTKSAIDSLRAREDGHIKIGFDYGFREESNRDLHVPFEARIPFSDYDGHLLVKVDYVQIRSGEQAFYNSDNTFNDQHTGAALGVGWETENWRADIGSTPVGFQYTQLVGGVERVYDFDSFSLTAALSRRPETSSTVSYSGITLDRTSPTSGRQEWGGVVKTGGSLGMSWDQGGPYGFWSSAQYHALTGKNVEDNSRIALLGGGYWKFIAEEDERLSIGLGAFYMSYDKNLGEYAPGHGAYYSPQSYFSLSLPVTYYGRYQNNWAYLASASVSNSWSQLDVPYGLEGSKESGGGFGYSLRLAVEKRLAPQWYLGALLDAERSDSYEPNHFQIYVKYNFNRGWQPIQTPPEPVTLYSDYY